MKYIFILSLMIFPCISFSQKYCLIDRKWRKPMIVKDTITSEDLNAGWFPVYKTEMDSLITLSRGLLDLFKKGMDRKVFNMKDFTTSHLEFNIASVKFAYGDRYDIDLISKDDSYKVSLNLSSSRIPNVDNSAKIKAFTEYLKDGKKAWPGVLQ